MTAEVIVAIGVAAVTLLQGIILYVHTNSKQRMRDDARQHEGEHLKMEDRCVRHSTMMQSFSERISRLEADMVQIADKVATNNDFNQQLSRRLEEIAKNMVTKEDFRMFLDLVTQRNKENRP